jgi:2-methylcitrate dehydratase
VQGPGPGLFAVEQTNIKMYPVRDSCQLPVDTAKALRAELPADRIAALKIETYASAYKGAVADPELWAPQTRETADHSMPVSVALTLLDGTVTPESFERGRFRDADTLDLIGRTNVEVNPDFSARTPAVRTCRLEATDTDGAVHVAEGTLTAGDIARGPTDAALEAKFMALAGRALPESAAATLWSALMGLDMVPEVASIVDLTRT